MRVGLVFVGLCLVIFLSPLSRGETDLDYDSYEDDDDCNLRGNSCKNCTDGMDDCFWCEPSKECRKWKGGNNHVSANTNCKGYNFYYKQCKLNGAGIIAILSVSLVLLVASCLCCCVCCCCCWISRRRKRSYERLQTIPHQQEFLTLYNQYYNIMELVVTAINRGCTKLLL